MDWRTLAVVGVVGASLCTAGCHRHHGADSANSANGDDAPKKKKKKGKKSDDALAPPPSAATWGALPADGTPSGDRYTAACKLPVHKDDYAGFTIGYPAGWEVEYGSGTIEVTKDDKGMTGALVFPARVRKEMKADQFADTFTDALGRSIRKNGGSFQLDNKVTDGHVARADATATIDGVKLKGPLQVVSEPGFATVKLYWAPVESFAAEEATLQGVVSCFERQMLVTATRPTPPPGGAVTHVGGAKRPGNAGPAGPVAQLQPFQSRYFVGQMPAGWKVQDETPNGIDVVSADRREAVGFGWVSNPVLPPRALVLQSIQSIHPGARILSSGPVQPAPDAPRGSSAFAAEYEAPDVHGLDNGSTTGALQVTTSLLATPDRWMGAKSTLAVIAHSIQITPTAVNAVSAQIRAQIASLPRAAPSSSSTSSSSSSSPMSSWESVSDKTNQNFDDALRGQDRATSPTTGTEYVVPQSAWNATGPQGAGYYRALPGNGGSELLNVQ